MNSDLDSKIMDIAAGFVGEVHAAGIGVWNDSTVSEDPNRPPGIVIGSLPVTPHRVIGVTPYSVEDSLDATPDVMGMQVRIRSGDRKVTPAIIVADQLQDHFHGIEHMTLGGHHIPLTWRNSLGSLGVDENGCFELAANYYMHVDNINE